VLTNHQPTVWRANRCIARRLHSATNASNWRRLLYRFLVRYVMFHPRAWLLADYMPSQIETIDDLIVQVCNRKTQIARIAQIGFNTGHVTFALLRRRQALAAKPSTPGVVSLEIVSFEPIAHHYTAPAARLIEQRFPGRHALVVGDPDQRLQTYAAEHPGKLFDLVILDGDRDLNRVLARLQTLRKFCRPGAVVIWNGVGIGDRGNGRKQAWDEVKAAGLVEEVVVVKAENGHPFTVIYYPQTTDDP
jgi:hypothetical protein